MPDDHPHSEALPNPEPQGSPEPPKLSRTNVFYQILTDVRDFTRENLGFTVFTFLGFTILLALFLAIYLNGSVFLLALKDPEVARGMITFLVTFTTIAVGIIMAVYVLGSGSAKEEIKERFSLGMQIFTALVGVLGTILGFYYGQATTRPVAPAARQTAPTPEQTEAWVKKAVVFYQALGPEKALAEFSDPQGLFAQDALTVYVLDLHGKMLANVKADLVGKDFSGEKDAVGSPYIAALIKLAREKGSGRVDFKWENPQTQKLEAKTVYGQKVDEVIICSESFKP